MIISLQTKELTGNVDRLKQALRQSVQLTAELERRNRAKDQETQALQGVAAELRRKLAASEDSRRTHSQSLTRLRRELERVPILLRERDESLRLVAELEVRVERRQPFQTALMYSRRSGTIVGAESGRSGRID